MISVNVSKPTEVNVGLQGQTDRVNCWVADGYNISDVFRCLSDSV